MRPRSALLLAFGWLLVGCTDPVHDERVQALGPETQGVPKGPLHRAGQPCLVCHDGNGPGNIEMSLAGTVYQTNADFVPAVDVVVDFTDALGRMFSTATNCAGNFYVQPTDYTPHYPLRTVVRYADVSIDMRTQIFRDGSCASCHQDPPSQYQLVHVYAFGSTPELPPQGCP